MQRLPTWPTMFTARVGPAARLPAWFPGRGPRLTACQRRGALDFAVVMNRSPTAPCRSGVGACQERTKKRTTPITTTGGTTPTAVPPMASPRPRCLVRLILVRATMPSTIPTIALAVHINATGITTNTTQGSA